MFRFLEWIDFDWLVILNDFCCGIVEYKVHSYNRNGLCGIGFMDDHYPVRSAFSLLNQVKY